MAARPLNGSAYDDDPPTIDIPLELKKSRRHGRMAAILVSLIAGSATAGGTYYATVERAKSNEVRGIANEHRAQESEKSIQVIRTELGAISETLHQVASDVAEMKRGQVSDLKDQLKAAQEELRRRRR